MIEQGSHPRLSSNIQRWRRGAGRSLPAGPGSTGLPGRGRAGPGIVWVTKASSACHSNRPSCITIIQHDAIHCCPVSRSTPAPMHRPPRPTAHCARETPQAALRNSIFSRGPAYDVTNRLEPLRGSFFIFNFRGAFSLFAPSAARRASSRTIPDHCRTAPPIPTVVSAFIFMKKKIKMPETKEGRAEGEEGQEK